MAKLSKEEMSERARQQTTSYFLKISSREGDKQKDTGAVGRKFTHQDKECTASLCADNSRHKPSSSCKIRAPELTSCAPLLLHTTPLLHKESRRFAQWCVSEWVRRFLVLSRFQTRHFLLQCVSQTSYKGAQLTLGRRAGRQNETYQMLPHQLFCLCSACMLACSKFFRAVTSSIFPLRCRVSATGRMSIDLCLPELARRRAKLNWKKWKPAFSKLFIPACFSYSMGWDLIPSSCLKLIILSCALFLANLKIIGLE